MADFAKDGMAGIAQTYPGAGTGSSGSLHVIDWGTEDLYWPHGFGGRPRSRAGRRHDYHRPAHRYGADSVAGHWGRSWSEVEPELRAAWDRYGHLGAQAWDDIKDAVRDAWNRVTRSHSRDTRRTTT